ncbi:cyclin-dependent kinase G-2-like [Oryza brachyantha]|uniref:cyclin-dependent kinase G-2-like n=1 Tax=Oryza brachyantha TaxID=4533 RepID=UPI0003EAA69B|nr:cyclin-dependent kinase G-2-like [Oryza brachyantha]
MTSRKRPVQEDDEDDHVAKRRGCAPPSSPLLLLSGVSSIHDCERLNVIEEGAFGVIYKGRDHRTGEKVALKWILGGGVGEHGPSGMTALDREVCCQAACSGYPSIMEILDEVQDTELGYMFLAMELADGGSLSDLISGLLGSRAPPGRRAAGWNVRAAL